MILRKIINTVATRCQILRLKFTKCGWAPADPAGEAHSAPPDPLAGFKGRTYMGIGRGRTGKEGKGRVRGKGKERKERGFEVV